MCEVGTVDQLPQSNFKGVLGGGGGGGGWLTTD